MKADLHYHGLIGFEPWWGRMQGYTGKNLTQLFADVALKKGIDLMAITSENPNLSRGHRIHDRFYRLREDARFLPKNYSHDDLGDVALIIEKRGEGRVIIVNGQTAIIREGVNKYDHLIIGSNSVPNNRDFDYVLNYCFDRGLPNFLEHLAVEAHNGVGLKRAKVLLDSYRKFITGIEGHNAQMIIPPIFSSFPVIGNYQRGVNNLAKQLAFDMKKPFISTSDGHIPSDLGLGYIEFREDQLDFTESSRFLCSLKRTLESGQFTNFEEYASFFPWIKWTSTLFLGTRIFPKV